MRRCDIKGCCNNASSVFEFNEIFLLLCVPHRTELDAKVAEIDERIANMTPEEMENRLEELNGPTQIH